MKNKSIIITGAGMGLGLAAAKELASKGANLVLVPDLSPLHTSQNLCVDNHAVINYFS